MDNTGHGTPDLCHCGHPRGMHGSRDKVCVYCQNACLDNWSATPPDVEAWIWLKMKHADKPKPGYFVPALGKSPGYVCFALPRMLPLVDVEFYGPRLLMPPPLPGSE